MESTNTNNPVNDPTSLNNLFVKVREVWKLMNIRNDDPKLIKYVDAIMLHYRKNLVRNELILILEQCYKQKTDNIYNTVAPSSIIPENIKKYVEKMTQSAYSDCSNILPTTTTSSSSSSTSMVSTTSSLSSSSTLQSSSINDNEFYKFLDDIEVFVISVYSNNPMAVDNIIKFFEGRIR
jgi:hypothetical protein